VVRHLPASNCESPQLGDTAAFAAQPIDGLNLLTADADDRGGVKGAEVDVAGLADVTGAQEGAAGATTPASARGRAGVDGGECDRLRPPGAIRATRQEGIDQVSVELALPDEAVAQLDDG
jgi:hypothetical protein